MATEIDSAGNEKDTSNEVPKGTLAAVKAFLADHGNSASVVIQPIGRAGTRLTLVGADGVLGDQVVPSTAVAHAIVARFDELTEEEWDRELVSSVNPAPGHYEKMAGWVARQKKFPKARNQAIVG
ncbi:hypothetical protein HQO12_02875 [Rhodococcus fascians]|uniref:hypothetical protein n=1 Tax=Rhodococcoides fascians TaxID=1828 RepID=UPI00195FB301|nr:hypothetical protein [Rhodococcus fascians]MBM7244644.1 hypothetical protein [Rhodococcus fascians]MBY3807834.1 hypothetical protein [Rhodococcus fascians]MBY3839381.1 hypothetical protein [Rhodococcus fascians]MBY3846795.1 hypothetical protein [Rhodococcus fascians]MBY3851564.1 hypothetical protein [Rhodococcus fascians]